MVSILHIVIKFQVIDVSFQQGEASANVGAKWNKRKQKERKEHPR